MKADDIKENSFPKYDYLFTDIEWQTFDHLSD